jgi:hypothetical protein
MPLTRRQYGVQIAGFVGQIGVHYTAIVQDGADVRDPDIRRRLVTACEALHALFPRVRAMPPPPALHAAHATLCAALDRYDEAVGYRLAGASLLDQGDTERGVAIWQRAARVEVVASDLARRAAQQIRTG